MDRKTKDAMLSSMTGFGRATLDAPFGRVIAEVQSVNRKFLEIFVSLPKEFSRFEQEVRSWVADEVARGQVSVKVHVIPEKEAALDLLPDPEALRALKRGWDQIAKKAGFDPKSIDLPFLLLHSPLQPEVQFADEKDLASIKTCMKQALAALTEMKRKEGNAIAADTKKRFSALKKSLDAIRSLAPGAAKRARAHLAEKVKEAQRGPELDERLARELLLMAERGDIAEEITRLESHFGQFQETLSGGAEPVGRKMDFLIQEMGREINTIGSKALDAEISRRVVDMKSELEKIREQIQNLE